MDKDTLEQSETHRDATDSIEVYDKGKTWRCNCGHGIGTQLEVQSVKCASCDIILVDLESDEREFESAERQSTVHEALEDEEQTALDQFL